MKLEQHDAHVDDYVDYQELKAIRQEQIEPQLPYERYLEQYLVIERHTSIPF